LQSLPFDTIRTPLADEHAVIRSESVDGVVCAMATPAVATTIAAASVALANIDRPPCDGTALSRFGERRGMGSFILASVEK
jgi:hypothetical protein